MISILNMYSSALLAYARLNSNNLRFLGALFKIWQQCLTAGTAGVLGAGCRVLGAWWGGNYTPLPLTLPAEYISLIKTRFLLHTCNL